MTCRTPVLDFVKNYAQSQGIRMHMPGHKGRAFLGCEPLDITEIKGADALYEAGGILLESEQNASALFGSARTLYSTEGSSQCIRAMLYLAVSRARQSGSRPLVLAARNVHRTFVYAAALLDFDVSWLWPPVRSSICACEVTPDALKNALDALPCPPACVYLTSPDYLGNTADIAALAKICHDHGTLLVVDNAHGAYLRFLSPSLHPLDLGADMCCDSAHKTLPALTGSAYLHISKNAPHELVCNAKAAMALFGSTSPSYLIMASLDGCNAYLSDHYTERLAETVHRIDLAKAALSAAGYTVLASDPLRITIDAAARGQTGTQLADRLREANIECEFADPDALVLMLTPENTQAELDRLISALGTCEGKPRKRMPLPNSCGEQAVTIRKAFFAAHELVDVKDSLGRICGAPTVGCPPAIPIAVSGEFITRDAVDLFMRYGVDKVDVLK